MEKKAKLGLVFSAGMLLTFGGMAAAIVYADKLTKEKQKNKYNDDKINAEEPENIKDETLN